MEDKNKKDATKKALDETPKKKVGRPKKKINKDENKERTDKKEIVKEEIKKEECVERENNRVVIEKKSGFNVLEVLIIMFITLCFGGILGSALTYATRNQKQIITTVPEELNEFLTVYEDIKTEYYEEVDTSGLLESGIKGLFNFLGDKYSVYMDKEETTSFNEQVEGEYVGIGTEIQRLSTGETIISNPFEGGPAKKSGLQIGDEILKVDGEEIAGKSLEEVSAKVKGKKGTSVVLTIKREDQEMDITVTRENVELTSVTSKIYEENGKKIGYLNISIFAANTTNQFERALLELEKENIDSLAIDVRDNNGGYLSTVQDIASLFLKKGDIIYKLDTKGFIETVKDNTNTSRSYPVAVITNKASASASEILAATIKESYENGEVIGTSTYGKGTVQKAHELSSGATIKYTIQKWLTPNGNWINEVGLTPTKEIKLDEAYYENPIEENDNQLKETIKFLSEKE